MQEYVNRNAIVLNKTALLAKLKHSDMIVLEAKYVSLKILVPQSYFCSKLMHAPL